MAIAAATGSVGALAAVTGVIGRVPLGSGGPTSFRIGSSPKLLPSPGSAFRLNLRLTNRHRHALLVRRVTVRLATDGAAWRSGCRRGKDLRVRQLPRAAYPLRLPPRSRRDLRQLGVPTRSLPSVTLVDLPTDQDACQGVRLRLRYTGSARRAKR